MAFRKETKSNNKDDPSLDMKSFGADHRVAWLRGTVASCLGVDVSDFDNLMQGSLESRRDILTCFMKEPAGTSLIFYCEPPVGISVPKPAPKPASEFPYHLVGMFNL